MRSEGEIIERISSLIKMKNEAHNMHAWASVHIIQMQIDLLVWCLNNVSS